MRLFVCQVLHVLLACREKLRTNYQKLQFEVLGSGECLEERAELLQELATACQKFEEIRQFFWEVCNYGIGLMRERRGREGKGGEGGRGGGGRGGEEEGGDGRRRKEGRGTKEGG